MAAGESGLMVGARPPALVAAIAEAFAAAEGARPAQQRRSYQSVRQLCEPSYVLWADTRGLDTGERRAVTHLIDAADLALRMVRARGAGVRVLDLGCGDGAFLNYVHARAGLEWANLAGVAAEDERACAISGAPCVPDSSFALVDVETLTLTKLAAALEHGGAAASGRLPRFDLIVSFSTWWHLIDPLGSLCVAHDELLAPGGVLLLHGVPLSHLPAHPTPDGGVGEQKDLETAARLQAALRACGEDVTLIVQHETATPDWIRRLCVTWVQRKRALESARLRLPYAYAGGTHVIHGARRAIYTCPSGEQWQGSIAATGTASGAAVSSIPALALAEQEALITTASSAGSTDAARDGPVDDGDERRRTLVTELLDRCCLL